MYIPTTNIIPFFNVKTNIIGLDNIKFLLILGVVLIHSDIINSYPQDVISSLGIEVAHFISANVCACCVPCFFIISGFLFFNGLTNFSTNIYLNKLKRRVHTLLIPYLAWNAICALLLFLKFRFLHQSGLGVFTSTGVDVVNFVKGFWSINESGGYPFAFAFWFIRNLMAFAVLSPMVWILCKNKIIFLLLAILYIISDINIYGIEWFMAGAFVAMHISIKPMKFNFTCLLAASAIFWASCFLHCGFAEYISKIIFILQVGFGLYLAFQLSHTIRRYLDQPLMKSLVASTFIIYATHQCYCTFIRNFWADVCGYSYLVMPLLAYAATFITLVLAGYIFYLIAKRTSPLILSLLSGARG